MTWLISFDQVGEKLNQLTKDLIKSSDHKKSNKATFNMIFAYCLVTYDNVLYKFNTIIFLYIDIPNTLYD